MRAPSLSQLRLGLLVAATLGALGYLLFGWLTYCPPTEIFQVVFSGRWLREPFPRIHAGLALDQPTIGKFLLWPSLITWHGCLSTLLLRGLLPPGERGMRVVLAVFAAALSGLLMIEFLAPFTLIVHYIASMGVTRPRLAGLGLCLAFWIFLPAFVVWVALSDGRRQARWLSPPGFVLAAALVTPSYYLFRTCESPDLTVPLAGAVVWFGLVTFAWFGLRLHPRESWRNPSPGAGIPP